MKSLVPQSRWLLAFVPLALGLLLAAIVNHSGLANPVFFLRFSLSVLLWLAGLALSLLLAAFLWWRRRHQQQRQALQTQQAATAEDRRRFLQRLDHELKNPLMAMRAGLANFANAPTPETRQAALGSVEAQTIRLSRLTADLRKIAELETRPLERRPVDLAQLLPEVVLLAEERPEGESRRLSLSLPQAPWPLPAVAGDWDLIYLALYNLLDNALKFTRPGDTIEVRAREDGGNVVIEVADTGPGIADEELPHVWEELYRGDGARAIPGSGLGMALVKAIAERHGGRVVLHSRAGQGTVVSLLLPVGV